MTATTLTYEILSQAVEGRVAAIRARTRLEPVGGSGDKVFPPTFGDTIKIQLPDGTHHRTRYAMERRRIEGEDVLCVLLDSVASQANRMEEALQRAWDEGWTSFPIVRVDFTAETDEDPQLDLSTLGGDGYITSLEAPHRLADALLRDSMLDGLRFRASDPGLAFTEASIHNATPVYTLSPNALIFGMWDSTGPKGGQGAKYQRALVSEVVGVGALPGRTTGSRLDRAGIELNAGPIFKAEDPDEEWTVHEEEAATDKKGKPQLFSRRGRDTAGKPSSINHGNVTPTIDSEAGGVTLDYAEQVAVLSLPVLRRLRFPVDADGEPHPVERAAAAEAGARTALAALALAAVTFQRECGFDFRSRCAFLAEEPLAFELLGRDGESEGPYKLDSDAAVDLVQQAAEAAEGVGMGWPTDPVDLVPAPKLVELIRRSRKVAVSSEAEDGDA